MIMLIGLILGAVAQEAAACTPDSATITAYSTPTTGTKLTITINPGSCISSPIYVEEYDANEVYRGVTGYLSGSPLVVGLPYGGRKVHVMLRAYNSECPWTTYSFTLPDTLSPDPNDPTLVYAYPPQPPKFSISGKVTNTLGDPLSGVTISFTNSSGAAAAAPTTTASDGTYYKGNFIAGTYTVKATRSSQTIEPNGAIINPITIASANVTGVDFTFAPLLNAKVIATQVIDDYPKLVKDKPAMFRVTLSPRSDVANGTEFKNIKIELKAEQVGAAYSESKVIEKMYSYKDQSGENILLPGKITDEEAYKQAKKSGLDAVQLALVNSFKPAVEGDLTVKADVYADGFKDCSAEKNYTVQNQKEVLNIGYYAYKCQVDKDYLEKKIAAIFPIPQENVKLTQINFNIDEKLDDALKTAGWWKGYGELLQPLLESLLNDYNISLEDKDKIDKFAIFFPESLAGKYFKIGPCSGFSVPPKLVFCIAEQAMKFDTFYHELAHTYKLAHPDVDVFEDEDNRYKGIYAADEGFDFCALRRIANLTPGKTEPDVKNGFWKDTIYGNYWDFMCEADPDWIHKGHYEKLFGIFSEASPIFVPAIVPSVSICGSVNKDGTQSFVFKPVAVNAPLPSISSGPIKIEALDTKENILYYSFAPLYSSAQQGGEPESEYRTFSVTVPFDENVAKLRISFYSEAEGEYKELKEFARTSAIPQVLNPFLQDSADNVSVFFGLSDNDTPEEELSYSVYFRNGPDMPWRALAFKESYDSLRTCAGLVYFKDNLAGGRNCQIKIEASDGLNSGKPFVSGVFDVTRKAPSLNIAEPLNGSVFLKGEIIRLRAFVAGVEEAEPIDNNAFIWKAAQGGAVIQLGTGKELVKTGLDLGRYTITVEATDKNGLNAVSKGVDIEVDDSGKPDVSILGADFYPGQPDEKTSQIRANIAIFNLRKDTVGTVKVSVAGTEIGPFNYIQFSANQITNILLSFDRPAASSFDINIEVTGIADELSTENNSRSIRYPIQDANPNISDIVIVPETLQPNERFHVVAKLDASDGCQIAEYAWSLDGSPLANNNKPAFALSLNNGFHTLTLQVKNTEGRQSSQLTKTLKVGDVTAPTTPVVIDEGISTLLLNSIEAKWSSSDPESGIAEYQYRITRDSPTGPVVKDWTKTGWSKYPVIAYAQAYPISLTKDKVYYFGVKARNNAGLWSEVGYSDGIIAGVLLPPANFTATAGLPAEIKLNWQIPWVIRYALWYQLEYSLDGRSFTFLTEVGNRGDYTAILTPGRKYYFRVRSKGGLGGSGWQYSSYSNIVSAIPAPLPAPTSLTAVPGGSFEVNLSWKDNSPNESGFTIERSTDNVNFAVIASVASNVNAYTATSVTPGIRNYFRVRAVKNNIIYSGYSNVAYAIPRVLPAPTNLVVQAIGKAQVKLTWRDNSADEDGFNIESSKDGRYFGGDWAAGKNSTSAVRGPGVGRRYYRIRAYRGRFGSYRYSGYSNTVVVNVRW